jgi:hypothetical protein
MSLRLSRAMMLLAARCLGDHRREWALAMEAELEAAAASGEALAFAAGCLVAALREMPAHREGRFALASHALAFGLILPIAALLFLGALLGFPYLAFGRAGIGGFLSGHSEQVPLLNAGDWAIAPTLTGLVLVLVASQIVLAWFVLERDWTRVAAMQSLGAAALTTLVIVTGVLAFDETRLLPPVAGLIVEALAVLAVARWHDQLRPGAWSVEPGG